MKGRKEGRFEIVIKKTEERRYGKRVRNIGIYDE